MTRFDGARVLVTAGASGIGATLARRFAAEGARVAVCDQDPGAVEDFEKANPDILAMVADVTSEPAMHTVFGRLDAQWNGVDVLCANAGTGGPAGTLETLELGAWRACLSANLDGAFLSCRWAIPHMKAQKHGVILLTSSTAGLFGYPYRSPYATAKWGVIGLTKTLAIELGPFGIRANAICPGSVEGDRMDRVLAMEAAARNTTVEDMRAHHVRGTSMKTWVSADDVADTALFLASPAGAKISGLAFPVDGNTETLNA